MENKNLKLIYSSNAGNKGFKNELDNVLKIFTQAGFNISILRTTHFSEISNNLSKADITKYHTIVAAGGDGTINAVVNEVIKNNLSSRLGIIPSGTANDFARFLKLDKNYTRAAEIIASGNTTMVDVGRVNDRYFINVLGVGTITNISHYVDVQLKNTIGNMAYYLKAIEKFNRFVPIPITIKNSTKTINCEILFFLAMNTAGAGGLDNIAPYAKENDGMLDMIAIKYCTVAEIIPIIMKFLKGEHITDENVIYYQDDYTLLTFDKNIETNTDGDLGPSPPLTITVAKKAIEVYVPNTTNA